MMRSITSVATNSVATEVVTSLAIGSYPPSRPSVARRVANLGVVPLVLLPGDLAEQLRPALVHSRDRGAADRDLGRARVVRQLALHAAPEQRRKLVAAELPHGLLGGRRRRARRNRLPRLCRRGPVERARGSGHERVEGGAERHILAGDLG